MWTSRSFQNASTRTHTLSSFQWLLLRIQPGDDSRWWHRQDAAFSCRHREEGSWGMGWGAASFVCLTCTSDLILTQFPLFDPEPVRSSGSEKWYLNVTYSDCRAHLFPVFDCGQLSQVSTGRTERADLTLPLAALQPASWGFTSQLWHLGWGHWVPP